MSYHQKLFIQLFHYTFKVSWQVPPAFYVKSICHSYDSLSHKRPSIADEHASQVINILFHVGLLSIYIAKA